MLILISGYALLLGPLANSGGGYLHIMQAIGLMAGLFFYLFFVPYGVLADEVVEGNFPAARVAMGRIRRIIGVNLMLWAGDNICGR